MIRKSFLYFNFHNTNHSITRNKFFLFLLLSFFICFEIFSQETTKIIVLSELESYQISSDPTLQSKIYNDLERELNSLGYTVLKAPNGSIKTKLDFSKKQNAFLLVDGFYSRNKIGNLVIYTRSFHPEKGIMVDALNITDPIDIMEEGIKLDSSELKREDNTVLADLKTKLPRRIRANINRRENSENIQEFVIQPKIEKDRDLQEFIPKEDITKVSEEVFKLLGEDLVITATKRAQSLREVPGTVYVVTAEDIRKYGYRDLFDILQRVPGIEMQKGGLVYEGGMRGFIGGFGKPLMMVNGKEVNQHKPLTPFIAEQFRANNILRVEIVQGPASALYGANAFSGIINIITKEPSVEKNSGQIHGMGGEYRTYEGSFFEKRKIGENSSLQVDGYYYNTKGENFTSHFINTNPKNLIFLGDYPLEDINTGRVPYPTVSTSATVFGGVPPFSDSEVSKRIQELYPSRDPNTFYPFINMIRTTGGSAEFSHKYFYVGMDYFIIQKAYHENPRNIESNYFNQRDFMTGYAGLRGLPLFGGLTTSTEFMVQHEFIKQQYQYGTSLIEFDNDGNLRTENINPFALGIYGNEGSFRYKGFLQFEKDFSSIGNYLIFGFGYDRLQVATSVANFLPGFTGSYATFFPHGNPAPWAPDEAPFTKQQKSGFYIQDQQYLFGKSIQLTLGGRYDVHNIYGGITNPRIGLVATPPFLKKNTFKLLYGTAFREPSVFEYSTNIDYITNTIINSVDTGISALDQYLVQKIRTIKTTQPETIKTFEASWVTSPFPWLTHTLSAYRNWAQNIIVKKPSPDGITLAYGNEGNRRVDGFESSLKVRYKDLGAFSSYSHYIKTEGTGNVKYIESENYIFLKEYSSSYPLKIADRHFNIHPRHFTAGIDIKLSILGKYAPTIAVEHIWKDSMYTNAADENANPVKIKTPIFRQTNVTISILDFDYLGNSVSYDFSITIRNVNNYKNVFVNTQNPGTDVIYSPAEGRVTYFQGRARF